MKFYPHEKFFFRGGGAKTCFSDADWGGFVVVLTWEPEILAILKGCATCFRPLKGRAQKAMPCLGTVIYPFCAYEPSKRKNTFWAAIPQTDTISQIYVYN